MPRNNGQPARERRRQAAYARGGTRPATDRNSTAVSDIVTMVVVDGDTADANAAHQREVAAAKASRPAGGGHYRPDVLEAGLQRARHVSRWSVRIDPISGLKTATLTDRTCPIIDCERCRREVGDRLESALRRARVVELDGRIRNAKRTGVRIQRSERRQVARARDREGA